MKNPFNYKIGYNNIYQFTKLYYRTIHLFAGLIQPKYQNMKGKQKMPKTENKQEVVVREIKVERAIVTVEGKSDLVLNKMNASNTRQLLAEDRKAQAIWEAQHKNKWENIITSMHWKKPIPITGDNSDGLATNRECNEDMFRSMLDSANNAPCISAFGLKKSWGQAVVRQEIDKFSTKFDAAVNIIADGGLIPIKFTEWNLDERLMSPKRGAPVSVQLNHFVGWSAEIPIEFTTNVYGINEIMTVINYAGFSLGIGSGRSSGFGRYSIVDVK